MRNFLRKLSVVMEKILRVAPYILLGVIIANIVPLALYWFGGIEVWPLIILGLSSAGVVFTFAVLFAVMWVIQRAYWSRLEDNPDVVTPDFY